MEQIIVWPATAEIPKLAVESTLEEWSAAAMMLVPGSGVVLYPAMTIFAGCSAKDAMHKLQLHFGELGGRKGQTYVMRTSCKRRPG